MEKNTDAKIRTLTLAKILYERTDEDHSLTTQQLIDILENEYNIPTHRTTIPTDIAVLQEFGMDIQAVRSQQIHYNLLSREFDYAELKLLIDAVASSKFISKKKSEMLTEKIAKLPKKANTLTVKSKTATVKYKNLKKKDQTIARKKSMTISKAQGTVSYTKSSGNKKITINKKTGNITVKKGLKKGTYKVKIKVKAAGNATYKAATKTVTVKIKVK